MIVRQMIFGITQLVICGMGVGNALAAPPVTRPGFSLADYGAIKNFSELSISNDGKYIAYVVTPAITRPPIEGGPVAGDKKLFVADLGRSAASRELADLGDAQHLEFVPGK